MVGLVLVLLLVVAGLVSATGSGEGPKKGAVIKVGIVNLPPEESGYRQANVEDMNNGNLYKPVLQLIIESFAVHRFTLR